MATAAQIPVGEGEKIAHLSIKMQKNASKPLDVERVTVV
jgi:hypothetical protein